MMGGFLELRTIPRYSAATAVASLDTVIYRSSDPITATPILNTSQVHEQYLS